MIPAQAFYFVSELFFNISAFRREYEPMRDTLAVTSDLRLLLRELHVVEDAEDDSEEVVPPVLLESVTVALHDLEHDGEASVNTRVIH